MVRVKLLVGCKRLTFVEASVVVSVVGGDGVLGISRDGRALLGFNIFVVC
jgi:hypothetical protein